MVFNTYSYSASWGFWMMQRYMMCILWLNCPTIPTQIHILRSWFPVPQNVTAFGDKVLKEVIKLKMRFLRVNPTPIWLVALFFFEKKEISMWTCLHRGKTMWGHSKKKMIYKSRWEDAEWNQPCQRFDLGLLTSRAMRK